MIKSYFILLISFFSCSSPEELGIIYYYEQDELHTITPVGCFEMEKYPGLRKLPLKDKKLFELINSVSGSPTSINSPDVRYKIEMKLDTICLDYNGTFITADDSRGKIFFIDQLEKYIKNNRENSVPVTQPVSKPWK